MPLTHDFKETVRTQAERDPKFRQALLREAAEWAKNGEYSVAEAVLRQCVDATLDVP